MDNMFVWTNSYLGGPIGSIIAAIIIFIIGYLVALGISGLIRNLLARSSVNQRMNSSTGKTYDIEGILSKIVFWFVFIMAISGALSMLNLTAISAPFANMVNQVLSFIPTLIGAAIIGVIGWVIATIVRTLISKALSQTTLDERLSAEVGIRPMSDTVADIVYWFILLFVLTIVLGQLHLDGLFATLTNMIDKVLNFIPNIFIACIIFGVGYIVAKIVRGIVTNVVASINIQSVAEHVGVSDHTRIANTTGMLAFLVIIISSMIAALDALNIEVISRPATNMLNQIMFAIPNIIAAAAILGITYYVTKFIASIITNLLLNTGIDDLPEKVGLQEAMGTQLLSNIIGKLIIFFTMLFAIIEAANRLGFDRVSDLVTLFISFGADIILGAIILFIGFWLANIIAGIVKRSEQGSEFLANIVRILIMGLVLAMGLRAMGIADSIVNLAFGLTLGAVAVAFALSFGLGGREAAARFLRQMQDKIEEERTGLKVDTTRHTKVTTDPLVKESKVTSTSTPASTTSTTTNATPTNLSTTSVTETNKPVTDNKDSGLFDSDLLK